MEKEKKRIKMKKNQEKGITLIALVITIIVLLILAGVTIATLTGENGILTRATDAREQTELADEKEKLELSVVGALAKDNGGEIERDYLNDELTKYIGEEGVDYTLSETVPFVVTYLDSGRSYVIDENGNILESNSTITLEQAKNEEMLTNPDNSIVAVEDGTVIVPGGFKVAEDSADNVENGIVIEDSSGNQFVWIPVTKSEYVRNTTDERL